MAEVVMDASALLARIWREPGCDVVDSMMHGAVVCAVNLAEVVHKLVDRGVDDASISDVLADLTVRIEPVDSQAARRIGLMRRSTRSLGLSLADRACLELALRLDRRVLTADRAWAGLDLGVEVVLIR